MSYSVFAKHYDEAMGDMSGKIAFLQDVLSTHAPNAKSVLEFASGTGTILEGLSASYSVAGVELSPEMLAIARSKLPAADMHLGDMTMYAFDTKFDIVLCVYDSINHLLEWSDWLKLFHNAHRHLNEGGVFVFDINTIVRLRWLASQSHEFEPSAEALSINIIENDGIFDWEIAISTDTHDMQRETIRETSFPISQIQENLKPLFTIEAVIDAKGLPKDNPNWRPFFVCRKN